MSLKLSTTGFCRWRFFANSLLFKVGMVLYRFIFNEKIRNPPTHFATLNKYSLCYFAIYATKALHLVLESTILNKRFKANLVSLMSFSWLTHFLFGIKTQFTFSALVWFWPRKYQDKDLQRIRNISKLHCEAITKPGMILSWTNSSVLAEVVWWWKIQTGSRDFLKKNSTFVSSNIFDIYFSLFGVTNWLCRRLKFH